MSNKVILPFPLPTPQTIEIPTPANYRDGDNYLFLEFQPDDIIPCGFFRESKLFFRCGERRSGMIHALDGPRGTLLARLSFKTTDRVCVAPMTPGAPVGEVPTSSLKILGWLDEAYFEGWHGARMVIPLSTVAGAIPEAPIFVTSARL